MNPVNFPSINIAKNRRILWILAFIITALSGIYQRMTGPTYPYMGSVTIGETTVPVKLIRSETTGNDMPVIVEAADSTILGYVQFRRYKSNDPWQRIELERANNSLNAQLPTQPPAGKIIYFVFLENRQETVSLSGQNPVVARFKGDVPASVLIPHILLMFLAMLFSNRTAFEALDHRGNAYKYMLWTMGFFFAGGLVFGPLVQKYAFGEFWTGVPFGIDLTDNKTLSALLGWVLAWIKNRKEQKSRGWIFSAAILMLIVYLIPHSLLGSALDYSKME